MNFASIKVRIGLIVAVLGATLVFMVFFLSAKSKTLGSEIYYQGKDFIESFVVQSINSGMQAYDMLGDDSSIKGTIDTVKRLQAEMEYPVITVFNVSTTDGSIIAMTGYSISA